MFVLGRIISIERIDAFARAKCRCMNMAIENEEEDELTEFEKELLDLIISHILNQILPCLR
jgi:hypothetical protein